MGTRTGDIPCCRIRTEARRGLRWGVFSVLLCCCPSASAQSKPFQPAAAPYSDIVVDANSGAMLHSDQSGRDRHPASLTKIMTLYLLFEQLEAGKLKLDSQMKVSEPASEQSPTKLGLKAGSTILVEDAIKGIVTRSANDASVVVAEAIAGNEEEFAALMTRKARALGMSPHALQERFGPAERRSRSRPRATSPARPRDPGALPQLLPIFPDPFVHLPRPVDRQSQ